MQSVIEWVPLAVLLLAAIAAYWFFFPSLRSYSPEEIKKLSLQQFKWRWFSTRGMDLDQIRALSALQIQALDWEKTMLFKGYLAPEVMSEMTYDARFDQLLPEKLTPLLHYCQAFQAMGDVKHAAMARQQLQKRIAETKEWLRKYEGQHGNFEGRKIQTVEAELRQVEPQA